MRSKSVVLSELDKESRKLKGLSINKSNKEEYLRIVKRVHELIQELESLNGTGLTGTEQKEMRDISNRFSFGKFIREVANNGRLTGVELEVSQMGAKEAAESGVEKRGFVIPTAVLYNRAFAGQSAGVGASGGFTIGTEMMYQDALKKRLILVNAGVRYIDNLSGNIELVEGSNIESGWVDENEEGGDSKKTFTKKTVSPKRCFVNVPISKMLTATSSIELENTIVDDILSGHVRLIENAALNGSGEKEPLGLLNMEGIATVSLGENGGAPTFKSIVDLESEIASEDADVDSMAYLVNPKVRGMLKTTLKAASVPGYIWSEDGQMNGYRALSTTFLPSNLEKGTSTGCSPIILGDWSSLWLMQWGGLDIVVDPYSLKKEGAYEVTLNGYHNVFLKRKECFSMCKDVVIG